MIDAHVHIFPGYRSTKAIRWVKRYIPSLEIDEQIDESDIVSRLRNSGVSFFFNYIYPLQADESDSLNEFNRELSGRMPNAVCFGSVHPDNENREEIARRALVDLGLIGLKFHPFVQRFNILDKRMDVVYRTAEILGRPIVFHTGFDRFYGGTLRSGEMETIFRRYPKLVVVISHMFYPRINEAFRLLRNYENVYLDGTNLFSDYREPAEGENRFEGFTVGHRGEEIYKVFFNHPLEQLEEFSDRVMTGSDYPVAMNYPEKIYEHLHRLNISSEARMNISENTAQAFVKRFKPDFFDCADTTAQGIARTEGSTKIGAVRSRT